MITSEVVCNTTIIGLLPPQQIFEASACNTHIPRKAYIILQRLWREVQHGAAGAVSPAAITCDIVRVKIRPIKHLTWLTKCF